MTNSTIDSVDLLHSRAENIIEGLRERLFDEQGGKTLDVLYKLKDVCEMVGKSQSSIYRAEEEQSIPLPERHDSGRRSGYSLEAVNKIRDHFGTRPYRGSDDEPVILAIQNFKGGVGKSTIACHASQYFAEQGYRVLIVDCDSQASTTNTFGFNPDRDISEDETLLPFLIADGVDELRYSVKPTHWDGLDIIPANLELYNAEYILSGQLREDRAALNRLKHGLADIAQHYDIVIIDPPPALGMISLGVLQAANCVVIPAPPSTTDFCSTASFLSMMADVLRTLSKSGEEASYKFVRFLITKADLTKGAQKDLRDAMGQVFADHVFPTALLNSVEYDKAALELRTIYEMSEGRTRSYERARRNMDQVFGELELTIRKTWASHAGALRDEGRA